jgi:hypothetical protein
MSKKKSKYQKREIEESWDDGLIEKFSPDATQRGYEQKAAEEAEAPRKPKVAPPAVKSHWREGMTASCPYRGTGAAADARTEGTLVAFFGAECLVLCRDGHIHRCFLSELA